MSKSKSSGSPKLNIGRITPSSSAPPDQKAPVPGADRDSTDGIQSNKGRALALTEEVPPKKK